jgi:hypothetical protein
VRRFCQHRIVLVQDAPPVRRREPLLILGEPHGLLVASGVLSFLAHPHVHAPFGLARGQIRVGVHRHLLRLPFVRDLLGALGCVSVGADALIECWAEGLSTLVFPEGVQGLGARLRPEPDVLPAVRLAHTYGIGIALVEFAGENDLFLTYGNTVLGWLRAITYSLLGVPLTFCCCRCRRPRLVTFVGAAVVRPAEGESLASFSARYRAERAALRARAQQHAEDA